MNKERKKERKNESGMKGLENKKSFGIIWMVKIKEE